LKRFSDVQVDRRRQNRERQRRHHHARGEQDGLERQETSFDRGGREESQRTQRHVHRNVSQGRLQRQTVVQVQSVPKINGAIG